MCSDGQDITGGGYSYVLVDIYARPFRVPFFWSPLYHWVGSFSMEKLYIWGDKENYTIGEVFFVGRITYSGT